MSLLKEYKSIDWEALLREDLGEYHLKELKPHLDYIKSAVNNIISDHKNRSEDQQNSLTNLLTECLNIRDMIKDHQFGPYRSKERSAIINFVTNVTQSFEKKYINTLQ